MITTLIAKINISDQRVRHTYIINSTEYKAFNIKNSERIVFMNLSQNCVYMLSLDILDYRDTSCLTLCLIILGIRTLKINNEDEGKKKIYIISS